MYIYEFIAGIALGYCTASIAESFLHRNVLHAGQRFRSLWKRYPTLLRPFASAYFSHHVIHHRRTFRRDFVTQFSSAAEKAQLDKQLPSRLGDRVRAERYGLTANGIGILRFLLPISPIVALYYWEFGPWVFLGVTIPMALYPFMSMSIHPLLHKPTLIATAEAPRFKAWLLRTRYVRMIARNHYMHHTHVDCNYNLLLGGDYLLGVHKDPGAQDIANMKRIGISVD